MKKDIVIPQVKEVYMAAVRQYNKDFRTRDWNVYLINNSHDPLETVLIVSQGLSKDEQTSLMRHKLDLLPTKSFAKVEFLEDSVLKLNNYFTLTYFIGEKLFDKKFEFPADSVIEDNAVKLPLMELKGVLAR